MVNLVSGKHSNGKYWVTSFSDSSFVTGGPVEAKAICALQSKLLSLFNSRT